MARGPRFADLTLAEAFDAFGRGEVTEAWMDDKLWLSLCEVMPGADDVSGVPAPVLNTYASRLIQWDVGNGGFAQAAYNYRDWFPAAAAGYRALGLDAAADLIGEGSAILARLPDDAFDADEIGDLFEQFAESALARLDARCDEVGWWADGPRLAYAVLHRAAFEDFVSGT